MRFSTMFWGSEGLRNGSSSTYFGEYVGHYIDSLFTNTFAVYGFVALLALAGFGLLMNYKTSISILIALFCLLVLEARLPALNDGGDNITRIVLIFMIFTFVGKSASDPSLLIWLRNIGIIAIKIQICILYFTSGFMKATGDYWSNGTAMYYISRVEWFSHPAMRDVFLNPYVTTIATYVPMIFMILFPFAVFSKLRLVWVFIGVFLHLGIGVFMGLISFSLVMIGLELFFLSDSEYEKIYILIKRIKMKGEIWINSFTKKTPFSNARKKS